MPSVSVIVPIYNVARYLQQCLDSLVNQTLADMEIICVNDGSTDGSVRILESYAEKCNNIQVLHQVHSGQSTARNKGLDTATGEYIAFVDADDWIAKSAFEELFRYSDNNNLEVAIYNMRCYSETRKIFFRDRYFSSNTTRIPYGRIFGASKLGCDLYRMPPTTCNKLISRRFLENNNIRFPEGSLYEDTLVHVMIMLNVCRASYIDISPYVYRMHRAGSTMAAYDERIMDMFDICKMIIDEASKSKIWQTIAICTLNFSFSHQYMLLKRSRGEIQKEYYYKMIKFWGAVSIGGYGEESSYVRKRLLKMEKLGYENWKKRDNIRIYCSNIIKTLRIDTHARNILVLLKANKKI